MKKERINIVIDKYLVIALDIKAKAIGYSRSKYIRRLLRDGLKRTSK